MPHPADLELTRRVLAGERAAFDDLFDRAFAPVLAHAARRLGPGARARAVTDTSLRELLDFLPRYGGRMSLDALALAIVRRQTEEALAEAAARVVGQADDWRVATRR